MCFVSRWVRAGQRAARIVAERRQGYAILEIRNMIACGVCFRAVQGFDTLRQSNADQLHTAEAAYRADTAICGGNRVKNTLFQLLDT